MKVQFILNNSHPFGANQSLLTLMEYLHDKGVEVFVLLPSKSILIEEYDKLGIKYDIVPFFSTLFYLKLRVKYLVVPIFAILDFVLFPLLLYKVRRNNPDIIYSNTSAENLGVFIARLLNKKHIWHVREFMNLDFNAFFVFGKKCKAKFLNLSDQLVFVSEAVFKEIDIYNNLARKSTVVYNGFNFPKLNIEEKELPANPIFGLVGMFDEAKNQLGALDYFVKILNKYPEAKLYFYGGKTGAYRKKVEKEVKKLKIKDKVIFKGFVRDKNEIYNEIDILLMFSRAEGFGRVTVEAMGMGVPVIGYNNGGTKEIINHKNNGYLFEDLPSFKIAINELLGSKGNFNQIRIRAFKHVKEKYSKKQYAENILGIVNRLV